MITSSLLASLPGVVHSFGVKDQEPPDGPSVTMNQVHGNQLQWIDRPSSLVCDATDGLLTESSGVNLGIKTADCVPLLFYDPKQRRVAAIHAGWKGTLKKIAEKTIQEMKTRGTLPEDLRVAIGPCVRDCCFEVEHDVSNLFQKHFARWREFVVPSISDKRKWTIDLQECNHIQIRDGGVLPQNIDIIPLCTSCRDDLFHSVRREGDKTGRMISFIRML